MDRIEGSFESAEPAEIIINEQGTRTLRGYAVVWGAISSSPSKNGIRYGFDRGSIKWQPNTFALWSHDKAALLATTQSKTLRMTEDDKGVAVEIDLPNTTLGNDVYELVRTGRVRGMSFFGYGNPQTAAKTKFAGQEKYTQFDGYEVTITPNPAMVETSIEVATPTLPKVELKPERKEQVKNERYALHKLQLDALRIGGQVSS